MNERYEKRIYIDAETDATLGTIAFQLGFLIPKGPLVGQGSKQDLLAALATAYREDAERVLRLLKQIIKPDSE